MRIKVAVLSHAGPSSGPSSFVFAATILCLWRRLGFTLPVGATCGTEVPLLWFYLTEMARYGAVTTHDAAVCLLVVSRQRRKGM